MDAQHFSNPIDGQLRNRTVTTSISAIAKASNNSVNPLPGRAHGVSTVTTLPSVDVEITLELNYL